MWREFILQQEPSATYFPGGTETQITSLEKAVGVVIPDNLKQLLTESNGVLGKYELRLIWPVEEIIKRNVKMRTDPIYHESYMPFDNLLFFADAGNGDQFGFRIIQGKIKGPDVFSWNHEDDSRMWVAPSLQLYLEWWLTGKIKL
jgi:hypothetical protein